MSLLRRMKDGALVAGGGAGAAALIGGKVWVGSKWLEWRKNRAKSKRGEGLDRRQFAGLPRKKQADVLYYRRGQVKDLESIYKRGYQPRRGF
jgi:hypothetical protein